MCDVAWIKLKTKTYKDSKLIKIRNSKNGFAKILVWYCLLDLAGQCNNGGRLSFTPRIPYTIDDLAYEFGISLEIIQQAIDTFLDFEMLEYDENFFILSNWFKYQNVEAMEEMKEIDKQKEMRKKYNRTYREKQKAKRNAQKEEEKEEKEEQNEKKEEKRRSSFFSQKEFSQISHEEKSENKKISHNVLPSYYKEKDIEKEIYIEKEEQENILTSSNTTIDTDEDEGKRYFAQMPSEKIKSLPNVIDMIPTWIREYGLDNFKRVVDIANSKEVVYFKFWESTLKNLKKGIDFGKGKKKNDVVGAAEFLMNI